MTMRISTGQSGGTLSSFPLPNDGREAGNELNPFPYILYNRWLIRLRWLIIISLTVLAFLNQVFFHFIETIPMVGNWITVACLGLANFVYEIVTRKSLWPSQVFILLQIAVDMIALTFLLHFSGGIENPMVFAFVFHVILSSILFENLIAWLVISFSTVLVGTMAFGEFSGLFSHYGNPLFPHFEAGPTVLHASLNLSYVVVQVAQHVLFMSLCGIFVMALRDRLGSAVSDIRNERFKLTQVIQSTGIGLAILHPTGDAETIDESAKIWKPLGGMNDSAVWRKWFRELFLASASGKSRMPDHEKSIIDHNGEKRYYQITLSNSENDVRTALISEITARKRIEAEMRHADRMSTLGKMSAGIAHEVGNPMASISARLDLLDSCDSMSEIKNGLAPLREQVARINRIIRGISQIARPTQSEWTSFNLSKVIKDTLEVVSLHKGSEHCRIECHLPETRMMVDGVEDQIEQVFLNLCLNAFDAMPTGGLLTISAEGNSDFHTLHFSDTGCGMDEHRKEQVFDLFFTTKKNGLGIGLHIAYQIITAHKGTISVISELGKGTTFSVSLPKTSSCLIEKNEA